MTNKQIVERYLLDYLKRKEIPIKKCGKVIQVKCPYCGQEPFTSIIPPNCYFINCHNPNCQKKANIFQLVTDLDHVPNDEVNQIHFIKEFLNLNIITQKDKDQIEEALNFYKEQGFDLVPVAKNQKNPVEKEWTSKTHKDKEEWEHWLSDGINIGIKTGKSSNLVVLDIDQKEIPKEIFALLGNTFVQESSKGWHYFYRYVELPKTRINDLKIDIESEGGQVVCYPSVVKEVQRKISNLVPVAKMSPELLAYLQSKITVPMKSLSEKLKEDIQTENFKIDVDKFKLKNENLSGCCNTEFLKLGGLLRKELPVKQVEYVLNVLNEHMLADPMSPKAISAMMKSLDKYTENDEEELAHKILTYLRDVDESSQTDIAMTIEGTNRGEPKRRVAKVLRFLEKEKYIIKHGNRYKILRKMEWTTELLSDDKNSLDFEIPYFGNIHNFCPADLILLGASTASGKTHLAMNLVKRFVAQGVKPYYLSLEASSRWKTIALQLGLKEGDFYSNKEWIDPVTVEFEKDSVTILDWLCPKDFAEVDKIFMHFTEQLHKTKGFLIVFMQLKEDGSWFAPNLVKAFPTFAVKFIHDNPNDKTVGHFQIEKMRDSNIASQIYNVPFKYDFVSKEIKTIEELQENKEEPKKNNDEDDGIETCQVTN